jgi:lipoate-protein ligase B
VTFHGIALNVSTDLSYFRRINPCGFDANIMTSVEEELGRPVDIDALESDLVQAMRVALSRESGEIQNHGASVSRSSR